jgi:uncharacterized protein (TIRG00374 family)
VLGVVISLALLWWALHGVGFREIASEVSRAQPLLFAASILAATLTFPLRTMRWRYLLRLEGETLPLLPLWHATAIGFMANNLLPARAGEFARAFAAGRLTGVRFSTALASVAVERIMDGMAMVALMMVAVLSGGFSPGARIGGVSLVEIASGTAIFFAGALAFAVLIVNRPALALRAVRTLVGRLLPDRFAGRAMTFAEGLVAGLDSLRSPTRFAAVVAWSLAVWCMYAASFWLCFKSFRVDVPWTATFLLQALIGFSVAIPSSPGFFGPFEAATRATLALYGIDASQAVSFAVAYHIGSFIPISVLGLWSLSRSHMHLADLRRGSSPPTGQPPA